MPKIGYKQTPAHRAKLDKPRQPEERMAEESEQYKNRFEAKATRNEAESPEVTL